jgi:hypothetical protein
VQPWFPRRTTCSALPLPSAGVAPLLWYYGELRHPRQHGGRSSYQLCFRYSSLDETAVGFPSSATHPFPGMPRSPTPADSPAQSPLPTPTGAFPNLNTVGICSIQRHGAQLLHLRCGLSVALSTLQRVRYLARCKTRFPVAGWALSGRESHPLNGYGFVSAHSNVVDWSEMITRRTSGLRAQSWCRPRRSPQRERARPSGVR